MTTPYVPPTVQPEYLTLAEASVLARTPIPTLRQWVREGRIQAYRPGRKVLVLAASLRSRIEGSRIDGGSSR